MIQKKLLTLNEELLSLKTQWNETIERRVKATTAEERLACAREAGALSGAIIQVEGRIAHATRLVAHVQGDEHQKGTG